MREFSEKRRVMIAAIAVFAITPALAACGGGDETASGESVEKVAQYKAEDRQSFLEKCADDEGSKLSLYTSQPDDLWKVEVAAFNKKYPDIKVTAFRTTTGDLIERLHKEDQARAHNADVVALKDFGVLQIEDLLTSIWSPEMENYPDTAISKDDKSVVSDDNLYGVAYNTDLVSGADVPKTMKDLLDPKWKGKMQLTASMYGSHWVGLLEHLYGDDIIEQFGAQEIRTQNTGSSAITPLVAGGEAYISPMSTLAEVKGLQDKGAPIEWLPIDPQSASDSIGLTAKAKRPCAGMLYIDFVLSLEGQKANMGIGYESLRTDIPAANQLKGQKVYNWQEFDNGDYPSAYSQWTADLEKYIVQGAK